MSFVFPFVAVVAAGIAATDPSARVAGLERDPPGANAGRVLTSAKAKPQKHAARARVTRTERTASVRDRLLVSPQWLSAHLLDPELVLLHVGDEQGYRARHLPGARRVALEDISVSRHDEGGLMLEMLPTAQLRERLQRLGVSDSSRIVVYFAEQWLTPATRVVFTLDHAGLGEQTSLLDGGMTGWIAHGGSVTDVVPGTGGGKLAPLRTRPIVVDAEFVRSKLDQHGFVVVDARAAALYDGTARGGSKRAPHRAGHIAGATSIPFSATFDAQMRLHGAEQLAKVFADAGVKAGERIIGYCHIGEQATLMLFAARTLGFDVMLYDGSFEDWSRRSELPVVGRMPAPQGQP